MSAYRKHAPQFERTSSFGMAPYTVLFMTGLLLISVFPLPDTLFTFVLRLETAVALLPDLAPCSA